MYVKIMIYQISVDRHISIYRLNEVCIQQFGLLKTVAVLNSNYSRSECMHIHAGRMLTVMLY